VAETHASVRGWRGISAGLTLKAGLSPQADGDVFTHHLYGMAEERSGPHALTRLSPGCATTNCGWLHVLDQWSVVPRGTDYGGVRGDCWPLKYVSPALADSNFGLPTTQSAFPKAIASLHYWIESGVRGPPYPTPTTIKADELRSELADALASEG